MNENISKSETPQLSIIISSYNSQKTIEKCLDSLKSQETDKTFEVILVDSSKDGTSGLVEEKFSQVRLLRFSQRKFPGGARNFGICMAKGKIIAFMDADCTAEKNWVNEILKAHQSPSLAIGGAIANGNPSNYVGWAAYFCEFSQWMPGQQSRWMKDIAAANMSYKREVFEKYGMFIEGTYCSDTEFHWRLGQSGYQLRFVPSIRVSHHNIERFRKILRHEYSHGQDFARVRIKSQSFSRMKKGLYAFLSVLIPAKLIAERGLSNFKNRIYLVAFLKTFPLLILSIIAWSLGECAGYIGGAKK